MSTIQEKIAVMQAFADGKRVEYRDKDTPGDWRIAAFPCWDWEDFDYRIKSEPRRIWVNFYTEDFEAYLSAKAATDAAQNCVASECCVEFVEVTHDNK